MGALERYGLWEDAQNAKRVVSAFSAYGKPVPKPPYQAYEPGSYKIELRKPSSPLADYQAWAAHPHYSRCDASQVPGYLSLLESTDGKNGWEYRAVKIATLDVARSAENLAKLSSEDFAETTRLITAEQQRRKVYKPFPGYDPLEGMTDSQLAMLAQYTEAERGRRKGRKAVQEEAGNRERLAQCAPAIANFLAGVYQTMCCRTVLRWSKDHTPLYGSAPSAGDMWTMAEVAAATRKFKAATGFVSPWEWKAFSKTGGRYKAMAMIAPKKPAPAYEPVVYRRW